MLIIIINNVEDVHYIILTIPPLFPQLTIREDFGYLIILDQPRF